MTFIIWPLSWTTDRIFVSFHIRHLPINITHSKYILKNKTIFITFSGNLLNFVVKFIEEQIWQQQKNECEEKQIVVCLCINKRTYWYLSVIAGEPSDEWKRISGFYERIYVQSPYAITFCRWWDQHLKFDLNRSSQNLLKGPHISSVRELLSWKLSKIKKSNYNLFPETKT